MESKVKFRSMPVQILLMIVTFGFYSVYWYYWTCREMESLLKREENIFLWTIFLAVPFFFFFSYYKQGEFFEQITRGEVNRWIIFILWIFFPPAVWFMVQRKLNAIAAPQLIPA